MRAALWRTRSDTLTALQQSAQLGEDDRVRLLECRRARHVMNLPERPCHELAVDLADGAL